MKRRFYCLVEEPVSLLTRNSAYGYGGIEISEDCYKGVCAVDFSTVEAGEKSSLRVERQDMSAEEVDSLQAVTLLCKEFGILTLKKEEPANVNIIFCDNGYMLVTLLSGCIFANLPEMIAPIFTYEDKTKSPSFAQSAMSQVLWVDADTLMSYATYMGDAGKFMYDFEFSFELEGSVVDGTRKFNWKHIKESDIDISLGYFAQFLQEKDTKERAFKARQMAKMFAPVADEVEYVEAGTIADDDEDEDDLDVY